MANAVSIANPVKELLKAGKVALGMNVRLARSGDIARIAKSSGHDFIFIDIQHSLFNVETIGHIAQAALGCGVAPLVRVRSCDDPDTSLLLDNGVTGIVFPDIGTAAEAQRAVNRARFAPVGRRSVSGSYPIFDFRAVSTADAVQALNDNTLVVCMIETVEGLQNIEEIAAVDGIDMMLVGSSDMTAEMGIPGQYEHPKVKDVFQRTIAACRKHGKHVGVGGLSTRPDLIAQYVEMGARFVSTGTDLAFLSGAATQKAQMVKALRK